MAKLWSFGCSMAWGSELFDPPEDRWSRLVADHLGLEDHNYGRAGSSNTYIHRCFWNQFNNMSDDDVVIIMWTDPRRSEHIIPESGTNNRLTTSSWWDTGNGENNPTGISNEAWRQLAAEWMYVMHPDKNFKTVESMHLIYSVYTALKLRGIRFMFCWWDRGHLPVEQIKSTQILLPSINMSYDLNENEYTSKLMEKMTVDSSVYTKQFFQEDAEANNFSIGPTGRHPLEDAHEWWAQLLIEELDYA